MKKIILLLLFVTSVCNAQIVAIPDANFKAKLIQLGVDANSNGNIELFEAQVIDDLNVSNASIVDLTGITSFTNLTSLNCNSNQIQSLDLSGLTMLTYFSCSNNPVITINASGLSSLFSCDVNCPSLISLNLSNCFSLNSFSYNNGSLTNLNLTGCSNLQSLFLGFSLVNTLILENMPSLYSIECRHNSLTSITITNTPFLHDLLLSHNELIVLDLSQVGTPYYDSLHLDNNQLNAIIFPTTMIGAGEVFLMNNNLPELDFSHVNLQNTGGIGLDFSNNPLLFINFKNGFVEPSIGNPFSPATPYYICQDENQITVWQNIIAPSSPNTLVGDYCSFAPGGNYNTISGVMTFDTNNNGCDASDVVQSSIKLAVTDVNYQGTTFSNASGNYSAYVLSGNYTLTPSFTENSAWFTFSPSSANVSFVNNNNNTFTQNFCVSPNGVHPDVEVVVAPQSFAQPGFDAVYHVVFKNKGNQVLNGNVVFNYPEAVVDYVSATQVPNVQSAGSLSWNYTNLMPFEVRDFKLTLNVNSPQETPAVNIGDILNFTTTVNAVTGDELPLDNTFSFSQTVIGSYDPNNKVCLEGNVVPTSKIGDYLHYTINFENTGTAPATFIVVKDMIDTTKFDLSSLQIMNASHAMETRITGNKVEYIFNNINLGPNEHGNVTFKIKTKTTLVEGNTVTNNANIYFDYNFPIQTNTASTTFQTLLSDQFVLDNSVSIAPNPTKNYININNNNNNNINNNVNDNIKTVELFDVQGRVLTMQIVNNSQSVLDVSNYTKGIYFVKVTTEKGSKVEKIIKE